MRISDWSSDLCSSDLADSTDSQVEKGALGDGPTGHQGGGHEPEIERGGGPGPGGEGQCDQRAAGQGNSTWPLRQGAQGPAAGGDLLGAEGSHQDHLGAAAYPAAATAATRSSMVAMAGSCNTSMRPVLKCTVAASTPASAWSSRSYLAMPDGPGS